MTKCHLNNRNTKHYICYKVVVEVVVVVVDVAVMVVIMVLVGWLGGVVVRASD